MSTFYLHGASLNPTGITLKTYIKRKIRMLERDFWITLSQAEKDHFWSLASETAVDNYAKDILSAKL